VVEPCADEDLPEDGFSPAQRGLGKTQLNWQENQALSSIAHFLTKKLHPQTDGF
jgi:hypothetical protein